MKKALSGHTAGECLLPANDSVFYFQDSFLHLIDLPDIPARVDHRQNTHRKGHPGRKARDVLRDAGLIEPCQLKAQKNDPADKPHPGKKALVLQQPLLLTVRVIRNIV